jgi:hypothetical protein
VGRRIGYFVKLVHVRVDVLVPAVAVLVKM